VAAEHLRVGAIKGKILDADGSAVIYDLFTEFGVSQHTEIDFDLDNASPAPRGDQEEVPRHPAQDRGRARRPALPASVPAERDGAPDAQPGG
jgi:Phage major capsid protein E